MSTPEDWADDARDEMIENSKEPVDTEFKARVVSNKGNEFIVEITKEIRCFFNQYDEIDENSFDYETESAIDEFFSNKNIQDSLEECEYLLEKKLADDERIIGFTELKAVA